MYEANDPVSKSRDQVAEDDRKRCEGSQQPTTEGGSMTTAEIFNLLDESYALLARLAEQNAMLRQRERYHRELQRVVDAGWIETDLADGSHRCSDTVCEILEIEPPSAGPAPDLMRGIIHPDDQQAVAETRARSISERRSFEDDYRACAFDRDISERVRAMNALRESEGKFRAIFENAPYIVTINRVSNGIYTDAILYYRDGWTAKGPDSGQHAAQTPAVSGPGEQGCGALFTGTRLPLSGR